MEPVGVVLTWTSHVKNSGNNTTELACIFVNAALWPNQTYLTQCEHRAKQAA